MIQIDLLTQRSSSNAVITIRRRWPATYRDEAAAIAGGIALVQTHPEVMGFVVLLPSQRAELDSINAAAHEERTITRAIAARRARQARKAAMPPSAHARAYCAEQATEEGKPCTT